MSNRAKLVLIAVVFVTMALSLSSLALYKDAGEGKAIQLFNGKNLDGWYTYLQKLGKNTDPEGVFKVENGIIHISGKIFGYIMTEKEYENYHLIVEFKWGTAKWPPRENAKRDSGILYHVVGEDKVWPKSLECQVQEGDCGDFFLIGGATVTGKDVPTDDGKPRISKGRIIKYRDAEKPTGEWNVIEVIADGDTCKHIVNGVVVNEGFHSNVTKGKILIQSEGAEVFYRKIELRPLLHSEAAAK
jgi:hypothetical protein